MDEEEPRTELGTLGVWPPAPLTTEVPKVNGGSLRWLLWVKIVIACVAAYSTFLGMMAVVDVVEAPFLRPDDQDMATPWHSRGCI